MQIRRATRRKGRPLVLDVLEDRCVPSAARAFDLADPPGHSDDGPGMGREVRAWTHDGAHGRELAERIHQAQSKDEAPGDDGRDVGESDDHGGNHGGGNHGGGNHGGGNRGGGDGPGNGRTDRPNAEPGAGTPGSKPTNPGVGNPGRTPTGNAQRPAAERPTTARVVRTRPANTPAADDVAGTAATNRDSGTDAADLVSPGKQRPTVVSASALAAFVSLVDRADSQTGIGFLGESAVAENVQGSDAGAPTPSGVPAGGAATKMEVGVPSAGPLVETPDVSAAEAQEGSLADLSAEFVGVGPVARAFEQLADWAADEPVRGWLPWLGAAALAGVAAEVARRQLRPGRGRDEADPELPPGWLPEKD